MPLPPEVSVPSPADCAVARNVYRTPIAFGGLTVFVVIDSHGQVRRRCEVMQMDATPALEDQLRAWLDEIDPPGLRLVG